VTLLPKYKSTHPWLRFSADLREAPIQLWMLLGEARSKCEHVAGVPLPDSVAKELYRVFLAKGVHSTTAIEGNTLSEKEVRRHLEGNLEVPESQGYQVQEIANLVQAFDSITARIAAAGPSDQLSPTLIREFNRQVLRGLPVSEEVRPGELRQHEVTVGRYLGAPAENLELLLAQLCQWLNEARFDADGQLGLGSVILKAVLAHLYLAWIHPFGDGNGRTARLVEFYLLVNAGVPDPSAHLLSNHYNATRSTYYRELQYASESGGRVDRFLLYATKGFVEQLREQLELIRGYQWDLSWKDFVVNRFARDSSPAAQRQQALVLALSGRPDPVPRAELLALDPKVAALYARVSERTLMRDLKELVDNGLVEEGATGCRARREVILAFLPATWKKPSAPLVTS
jgi:Fic family protein